MKVLADMHHQQLFHSLELLFEKRLGWELYTMKGLEWFNEGFWKGAEAYANNVGTVGQYLGLRGKTPDSNGVCVVDGTKGLTLEGFKTMPVDIVIASIPAHVKSFNDLIKKYKPQAKLIYQVGNHFGSIDFSLVKNLMSSTMPEQVPSNVNAVFYHQEFSLDVFKYEPPQESKAIRSFVHTLSIAGHFQADWQDFLSLEKALPELKFEAYGAGCRDGCIGGEGEIARLIRESLFGFHLKNMADGFGHTIHNWFACGRPVIVRKSQYQGKLAGQLMIDGLTCIDLDKGSLESNVERIRKASQPEEHNKMCQQAFDKFKRVCDFDKEFLKIKTFLEKLG